MRQELLAQILQRDGLPRHRSSNGADHAASSSPSRGRRPKTCPVLRRVVGRLVRCRAAGTPKDLCGRRGPSGPDRALPAAASGPARRIAAGQRAISVAEADGNRTRLGALAPTPVLKFATAHRGLYFSVLTHWFLQVTRETSCCGIRNHPAEVGRVCCQSVVNVQAKRWTTHLSLRRRT